MSNARSLSLLSVAERQNEEKEVKMEEMKIHKNHSKIKRIQGIRNCSFNEGQG
jgi:hypothetical protein